MTDLARAPQIYLVSPVRQSLHVSREKRPAPAF